MDGFESKGWTVIDPKSNQIKTRRDETRGYDIRNVYMLYVCMYVYINVVIPVYARSLCIKYIIYVIYLSNYIYVRTLVYEQPWKQTGIKPSIVLVLALIAENWGYSPIT